MGSKDMRPDNSVAISNPSGKIEINSVKIAIHFNGLSYQCMTDFCKCLR